MNHKSIRVFLAVAIFFCSYLNSSAQIMGETCDTALPISVPSTITAYAEDNWYFITPDVSSTYEISMCGLNTCDTRLWLYSACPADINSNDNLLIGNDDSCGLQSYLNVFLVEGVTYLLRVGDFSNSCTGPVTFSISSYEMFPGCTDPSAENYDATANVDDGSCIVNGCTDPNAINYNATANTDDGSCEFCDGEGSIVGTIYLCTFSNAAQVELQILNSNGEVVAEMYGASGGAIQYGEICLAPGECYTAVMSNNAGPYGWYNGYFWVNNGNAQIIHEELSDDAQTESVQFSMDGTCGQVPGCTDPNASNFNPEAQIWDGSCIYEGCTDPIAINYNWNANVDDGSCDYCTNGVVASVYICTYSNGNQVELQILDSNGNEVMYLENLGSNVVFYSNACFYPNECYTVNMINNAGPYGWYNGYYWIEINGVQFALGALASGQSLSSTIFSIDGTCGESIIAGCTDPSALNFDPLANISDNSCIYPIYGCMDETALNFNANANVNEGCIYIDSCESNLVLFNVEGSIWPNEISFIIYNSNNEVVFEGASGVGYACLEDGCYSIELLDSFGDGWNNGVLTVSVNGDLIGSFTLPSGFALAADLGINATDCGLFTSGCTDPLALNYDPTAFEDDGSCIYPEPCDYESVTILINTAIWANEVSWMLLDANGVSVASGDDYENYSSYTSTLCLEPGCYQFVMEDNWGDGWNGANYMIYGNNTYWYGTLEFGFDGAVVIGIASECSQDYGCTDPAAINYNAEAIIDDGSCFYVGTNPQNFAMNPNIEVDMDLYPNPTSGGLIVDVNGVDPTSPINMKIVAMDGRLVNEFQVISESTFYKSNLDVSFLSAGYYFIQMTNGDKVSMKAFVKE